jgi:hypothetical protein
MRVRIGLAPGLQQTIDGFHPWLRAASMNVAALKRCLPGTWTAAGLLR